MKIQVLKPSDAPPGIQRLLPLLQRTFLEADYDACRMMVAFARLSGVVRLLPQIRSWRSRGGSVEVVVGIDRLGTSLEALEVMLDEFDSVYITSTKDRSCTFHPKMYLFEGKARSRGFVGSHNLTLGGLETNFEGGVIVDAKIPGEAAQWKPFRDAWDQLLPAANPCTRKLDSALLAELARRGQLLPESQIAQIGREAGPKKVVPGPVPEELFPSVSLAPPSPIPKDILPGLRTRARTRRKPGAAVAVEQPRTVAGLPRALVIEIIPHHNGEIFLSKQATDDFPGFFGMPFTGRTVPKIAGNPGYPMRVPDPVAEFRTYGKDGKLTYRSQFDLNTVYYERKKDIRITVTPSLARSIAPYSVMVIWGGSSAIPTGLDYVIDVFAPKSPKQAQWENAMNVTLPGGGKARARRMGWI